MGLELTRILLGFVGVLPFVVIFLGLLLVYKVYQDRRTPFDDQYELERNNLAASLTRGGAYFGIGLAMMGSVLTHDVSYWFRLGLFALDGAWVVLVFTLAVVVIDKAILWQIDNCDEIMLDNRSVGWAEAFAYVGLGAIMLGSFAGQDRAVMGQEFNWGSFLEGQLSALVFSLLGLLTAVSVYLGHVVIVYWRSKSTFYVDRQIHDGDLTAGIDAGSFVCAVSITLMFSIIGPFTGWIDDLVSYGIAAAASVVALSIGSLMARRLLTGSLFRRPRLLADSVMPLGNTALVVKLAFVRQAIGILVGLVTFI